MREGFAGACDELGGLTRVERDVVQGVALKPEVREDLARLQPNVLYKLDTDTADIRDTDRGLEHDVSESRADVEEGGPMAEA